MAVLVDDDLHLRVVILAADHHVVESPHQRFDILRLVSAVLPQRQRLKKGIYRLETKNNVLPTAAASSCEERA